MRRGERAVVAMEAPKAKHDALLLWVDRLEQDSEYLERFSLEEILKGKVTLLNESGTPGGKNWNHADKSHLWNFNLHYLEFLIPLAGAYQREQDVRYYRCFRRYCKSWMRDNQEGTGDGWHPYTISLRLTNLWICLDGFGKVVQMDMEFLQELENSMYAQYRHLQKHLERHLLGNHYFENLKAIVLGALYFQEPEIYQTYKELLIEQMKEQILADGIHYERSMMYHKIILEDLIRLGIAVMGEDEVFYEEIWNTLKNMSDAMYSMEEDMGHTPLFNDAGDQVARPYRSLVVSVLMCFAIFPDWKVAFKEAGYYCLKNDNLKLVLDAGEIGPEYMPGHGHCDGLSFELSWNGQPLFVNSGTGLYQGPLRSYFRSTAAHNTVVIDGEEQSMCWGEHRVGKRIHHVSGACGENWVKGSLTTCTGRHHARKISVKKEEEGFCLWILDKVEGQATAYLHLAPEYEYRQKGQTILVKYAGRDIRRVCEIRVEDADQIKIHKEGILCSYAPEFGKIIQKQVLQISWDGDGSAHRIQIRFYT